MNKILSAIFFSSVIFAAGCTKTPELIDTLSDGAPSAVSFGLSSNDAINLDIIPGASPTFDTTIKAFVSRQTYGSDIKLTLEIDNSLVDAYNAAHGTTFDYAPADAITLPAITIPANQQEGSGKVSINLETLLNAGTQFAMGVKIASVTGGPNEALPIHSELIFIMNARNQFDGIYEVDGTMEDYAGLGITGAYPQQIKLITTSASTCDWYSIDFDDYVHPISNFTSYYGVFCPQFKFDLSTNKIIAVTNYYGNPEPSRGRGAELDPSGENSFDPVTKTIKVRYWMNQTGYAPHRTLFDETFTYLGQR